MLEICKDTEHDYVRHGEHKEKIYCMCRKCGKIVIIKMEE